MAAPSRGLSLYRSILRLHSRVLPSEMRTMGDAYVREEFRKHRNAEEKFLPSFFQEWEGYVTQLEQQAMGIHGDGFGADIDQDLATTLTEEQRDQLTKLREASAEAFGGRS